MDKKNFNLIPEYNITRKKLQKSPIISQIFLLFLLIYIRAYSIIKLSTRKEVKKLDETEKALKALIEALEKANPDCAIRVTISISKKATKA